MPGSLQEVTESFSEIIMYHTATAINFHVVLLQFHDFSCTILEVIVFAVPPVSSLHLTKWCVAFEALRAATTALSMGFSHCLKVACNGESYNVWKLGTEVISVLLRARHFDSFTALPLGKRAYLVTKELNIKNYMFAGNLQSWVVNVKPTESWSRSEDVLMSKRETETVPSEGAEVFIQIHSMEAYFLYEVGVDVTWLDDLLNSLAKNSRSPTTVFRTRDRVIAEIMWQEVWSLMVSESYFVIWEALNTGIIIELSMVLTQGIECIIGKMKSLFAPIFSEDQTVQQLRKKQLYRRTQPCAVAHFLWELSSRGENITGPNPDQAGRQKNWDVATNQATAAAVKDN
eukprot:Gb_15770 [translate_table: standard]